MDIYKTITKQNPSWGIAGFWWFFVFLLCFSRIIKQSYKSNKISFSQSLAYIAIYIYLDGIGIYSFYSHSTGISSI